MNQPLGNVKALSRIAYTIWFGTLWGYTIFGHANSDRAFSTGLFYVFLISGLIGAFFIVFKNAKITNRPLKLKCTFADALISVVLLALIYLLPDAIGLIKAAIIIIVGSIYLVIYSRFFNEDISGA